MATEPLVDLFHPGAEQPAVGRSILPLVHQDFVVNHLVQENVFPFVFRQIETRADADGEAVVFLSAE